MTFQQVDYYTQKFEIGDYVYAKMKTYPPWPARVVGFRKRKLYVYFYGTDNYGYVSRKDVTCYRIFDYTKILDKKSVTLKKAISLFNKSIENSLKGSDEDVSEKEASSSYSEEDNLPLDYLMKVESSKGVISVNCKDEAAIKKLIPKELSVALIRNKPKQRITRATSYEDLSEREISSSESEDDNLPLESLLRRNTSSRSEDAKKKLFQRKLKSSKV